MENDSVQNPYAAKNPYAPEPDFVPDNTPQFLAPQAPGLNSANRGGLASQTSAEEARAIAEVKAQVFAAHQAPRNPEQAVDRILRECKRPTLAEKATYSFPRGKEMVSGPSINLATMMANNWGNIKYGWETLERRESNSVLHAYAWDMETNTYIERKFEVRHFRETRTGGYTLTDDRDIYELEANSSARRLRACLLQILPGDVVEAAVDMCRLTTSSALNTEMNDPKKRGALISKTIRIFAKFGASQGDMEDAVGALAGDWDSSHLLKLKEIKTGLEDGALELGVVFPRLAAAGRNETISKAQVSELMRMAADTGKQGDVNLWLKQRGISRMADVPKDRFDEVKAYVESLVDKGQTATANTTAAASGGTAVAGNTAAAEDTAASATVDTASGAAANTAASEAEAEAQPEAEHEPQPHAEKGAK